MPAPKKSSTDKAGRDDQQEARRGLPRPSKRSAVEDEHDEGDERDNRARASEEGESIVNRTCSVTC